MDPDLLREDELPAEVQALVEQAEAELDELRAEADREVDEIRAREEEQVEQVRRRADRAAGAARERAEHATRTRVQGLVERLRPLQAEYVKEGKLDEALAVRARVRQLRSRLLDVRPDPGTLQHLRAEDAGASLLYEVTGDTDGPLWGSDVYSSDSSLAKAAVHAGVLRPGERGVVRVTVVDGANVDFEGSDRHGVWSDPFGEYPVGFRVSRA